VLAPFDWRERAAAHAARMDRWVQPHLERAARGERHPVADFLFTYYRFRPARLREWHPGPGVVLAGTEARRFLGQPAYVETAAGVALDATRWPAGRRPFLDWLEGLLRATAARPPHFGCHGLHEWAMVYRAAQERRHLAWPLRLGATATDQVVESLPCTCTHFDAYRFFTAAARPRNRWPLERAATLQHEQRGCLHTNMDLYKWAFKLAPFVPAELIGDTFALAWDIRQVDMAASPYDLQSLGCPPIPIETAQGREIYAARQRDFAARSQPLRARLLAVVQWLRAAATGDDSGHRSLAAPDSTFPPPPKRSPA
jgi:hypothetical protein